MLPSKEEEKNVNQPIRLLSSDRLTKRRKKKNYNGNELSKEKET
jgi:hypothetical protein